MNPPHALLTGWIFDTYPTNGGMVVWIVDEAGKSHRLTDPFQPSFYAAGPVKALRQLAADLARLHLAAPVGMTHRTEFWSGDLREVLEFRLLDPERQPALLRRLAVPRPGITLYDCDLAPALTYCHARGIFPLAKVTATVGTTNDQFSTTNAGAGEANSKFEIRNCSFGWRDRRGTWTIRSRRSR